MRTRHLRRPVVATTTLALAVPTALLAFAHPADATPVARQVRVPSTDWTSAAVGGVGSAGTGTLSVAGVSGTVTGAYLSWHGIGPEAGGSYNNASITFDGTPVTGVSQGESGSNCWGTQRTARTYFADVSSLVTGNGDYDLAGLGAGGDANGANLVVTYDDGNTANDRDLYLFYGNDTDSGGNDGF